MFRVGDRPRPGAKALTGHAAWRRTNAVMQPRPTYAAKTEPLRLAAIASLLLMILLPGAVAGAEAPKILRFAVDDGAAATNSLHVTLHSETTGAPAMYRASERRDLKGADWRPYAPAVVFHLSPDGDAERMVYMQVRRGDQVSRVARDGIRFALRRQTVSLPLGAARAHAMDLGWMFSVAPGNPFSVCNFRAEDDRLVLSARQKKSGFDGVCDFVLFGGDRRLAPGWKFVSFERSRPRFRNCRVRFAQFPVIEGRELTFGLRVIDARQPAAEKKDPDYLRAGCAYAIERITLEGPAGANWRQAFAP